MQRQNNVYLFECPVCHKKFKIEFAFKGHLRLTMDEAHVAFRQANTMKEEKKMQSASLRTTLAGTKLLDQLEALVEAQEKKNIIQDEQDACFNRIKDFVVRERKNDTTLQTECHQAGCDDTARDYEEKIIPCRLDQNEKKIRTECTADKEHELLQMKKNYEQKIADINRKNEEEITTLISKYGIPIPCPVCHSEELVQKNSQLHFEIVQLMLREGLGHLECVRMYDPQRAYFWDWSYRQYYHFFVRNYRRFV